MADESRPDSLDPGVDEALARFWNALGQGTLPDHIAIDPALVDTVRRVHRLGAAKPPDPAFVRRLRDEVFATGATASTTTRLNDGFRLNGRDALPVRRSALPARPGSQERRWGLAAGAVAALLLIALGLGYVAFDPFGGGPDRPSSIPAAYAPAASPSPVAATEDLLATLTLTLPPLEGGGAGLYQNAIPAATAWTWPGVTRGCCPGLIVDYVLSGTYAVRYPDDPVRVLTAGGALRDVPAGTELALGPGDALIARNEFAAEGSNPGPAAVQLLRWDFIVGRPNDPQMPQGWVMNAGRPHFALPDVAPGPATLQLWRIRLPAGATYDAPATVRDDLVFVAPMTVDAAGNRTPSRVAEGGDAWVSNIGNDPVTVYVLTLEPLGAATASPVAG